MGEPLAMLHCVLKRFLEDAPAVPALAEEGQGGCNTDAW